jgi:hypothetical protein
MTIRQLAFSDKKVVVYHSSSGLYVNTSNELVGFRVLNTTTPVLGPIIPPP